MTNSIVIAENTFVPDCNLKFNTCDELIKSIKSTYNTKFLGAERTRKIFIQNMYFCEDFEKIASTVAKFPEFREVIMDAIHQYQKAKSVSDKVNLFAYIVNYVTNGYDYNDKQINDFIGRLKVYNKMNEIIKSLSENIKNAEKTLF